MSKIRKISIGRDYKEAMHYMVGTSVPLGNKAISDIIREVDDEGEVNFLIYIKGNDEILLWKNIVNMPCVIEYDLNFK